MPKSAKSTMRATLSHHSDRMKPTTGTAHSGVPTSRRWGPPSMTRRLLKTCFGLQLSANMEQGIGCTGSKTHRHVRWSIRLSSPCSQCLALLCMHVQ